MKYTFAITSLVVIVAILLCALNDIHLLSSSLTLIIV